MTPELIASEENVLAKEVQEAPAVNQFMTLCYVEGYTNLDLGMFHVIVKVEKEMSYLPHHFYSNRDTMG